MINENFNKDSDTYVPSDDELGISKEMQWEMQTERDPIKLRHMEEVYSKKLAAWKAERKMKQISKKIKQKTNKELDLADHWYFSLPDDKKIELIERSRALSSNVFDKLLTLKREKWEMEYMMKLCRRVERFPISLKPAPVKKVKRFPTYNIATDKMNGSVYAYYRLWCHVFSAKGDIKSGLEC